MSMSYWICEGVGSQSAAPFSDMNVNIIGNKVFVNGSPLPPIPGAKSSVSLSQVGNRLYVNGYEYRNGCWKRTLRAIIHTLF